MKQGSTDDPFNDDPDVDTEDDSSDGPDGDRDDNHSTPDESLSSQGGDASDRDSTSTDSSRGQLSTPQRQSLPYIHTRDGVKDGRRQRPIFLREYVDEGIDDLVDEMEDEFGENVYKTDVTEAAMEVAQENPELVLAKLDEWGYGWT